MYRYRFTFLGVENDFVLCIQLTQSAAFSLGFWIFGLKIYLNFEKDIILCISTIALKVRGSSFGINLLQTSTTKFNRNLLCN